MFFCLFFPPSTPLACSEEGRRVSFPPSEPSWRTLAPPPGHLMVRGRKIDRVGGGVKKGGVPLFRFILLAGGSPIPPYFDLFRWLGSPYFRIFLRSEKHFGPPPHCPCLRGRRWGALGIASYDTDKSSNLFCVFAGSSYTAGQLLFIFGLLGSPYFDLFCQLGGLLFPSILIYFANWGPPIIRNTPPHDQSSSP